MGVLWILWAPDMLMPLTLTSCFISDRKQSEQKTILFGLHQNSNVFSLRAKMLPIGTRKKFNNKIPSVKRWRSIVLEIAPKAYKNLRNPLPPQTQTNESEGLLSVTDDGSRFPGKSIALQTRFVISIAQWCVEEDDTMMAKVAKNKGKTRGKKDTHRLDRGGQRRGKTTNRQTA